MAERAQILIRAKDETAGAFSSVQRNFSSMHSTLARFAPALTAALSVGGVVAFAKSAIDAGDAMADMSQKTGISVESLSKWKFVAEQSNTTLDGMLPGLKGLATNMESAARGSKESSDAFARLGVEVKDKSGALRGMDAVMLDLADRFSKMPDGAQKSALAVRVFGKAGQEMIPVLNQGRAGIGELMATAERLGLVMSSQAARAADDLKDSLAQLASTGTALQNALLERAAPAMSRLAAATKQALEDSGPLMAFWVAFGGVVGEALGLVDKSLLSTQEKIRETGKELRALESQLKAFGDNAGPVRGLGTREGVQRQIDAKKKELADLQAQLETERKRQDGQRGGGGDPGEIERRLKREEAAKKHAEALLKHQEITWAQMVEAEERGWKELEEIRKSGTIDKLFPANTLPEPPLNAFGLTSEVMEMYRERARVASESLGVEVQKHNELAAAKQRDGEQRVSALASLIDELRTERQVIEQDFAQKSLLLKYALDNDLITQSQYYDFAKRLDQRYTNDKLKLKSAETARLQMLANMAKRGELSAIAGLFSEAVPLMQSKSKTLFRIGKAAALAEAIVSTHQAVANALAVKPFPLGLALAAVAAAKGAIQIQAIRSADIGGGAAQPVFSANPVTGLPTSQFPEAPLAPQPAQALPQQARNVFISLGGSGRYSAEEVRELIGAINEQLGDNVRLHVN